ncbi:calmodulin-lysine N-methyltransferase-like [Varroa jacobsoni]|uniref:Calmodulin-lysine N-methyltransferase n=1 Tax=Varroa destructor TaxID=109461 RepID=A0A7M7JB06_VARDE|nr:calmodulin-lysine N-methyltransferase-like [Varroa destructor]XP_022701155.1 calmodulin-lysine N-methyltransferase-like [Varroa jacobsoni]
MAADIRKKSVKSNEKKTNKMVMSVSVAKMRWRMLAKALHEGRVSEAGLFMGSVRRFHHFGLLQLSRVSEDAGNQGTSLDFGGHGQQQQQHHWQSHHNTHSGPDENELDAAWFVAKCLKEPQFSLRVRFLPSQVSINELRGYNNTGNVCLWPSEEVMAYYAMKNKELFYGKNVLELGGGMTCLAGFTVAATARASEVLLTDGNQRCVANAQLMLEANRGAFGGCIVHTRRLRWDAENDMNDLQARFDVILIADCLYFHDGRKPLVHTIWNLLKADGIAVVLAPARGDTFQDFVRLATERGFEADLLMVYDTCVWELHSRYLKEKAHLYDANLHYPQMLILRKTQN